MFLKFSDFMPFSIENVGNIYYILVTITVILLKFRITVSVSRISKSDQNSVEDCMKSRYVRALGEFQ